MSVLILDFGSQFTQLIARRVRELHCYGEILPGNTSLSTIKALRPQALILSGGPYSVLADEAPSGDAGILDMGIPVLGICYGMQWMAHRLGSTVYSSEKREYGFMEIHTQQKGELFRGISPTLRTWMSHGDEVKTPPPGFCETARSVGGTLAAMEDSKRRLFALQFHPEVTHTQEGTQLLENFLSIAGVERDWDIGDFAQKKIKAIQDQVGPTGHAICALSGGVDSSVAAVLVEKALPNRMDCIYVDTGLQREGELEEVQKSFSTLGLRTHVVDAEKEFLHALRGVVDPEKKRKIIGHLFVDIFHRESKRLTLESGKSIRWMVQGTLYPDVIESVPPPGQGGFSSTIKSHHNVGGLPKDMPLELIEPLRELFKDEVRVLAGALGIPQEITSRHPFPGPGLAVRCLGEVTSERLQMLRSADKIYIDILRERGLYHKIWQAGAILLPISTVGVMGDGRTYENPIALRAVVSDDGMTANWYPFNPEVLKEISSRIVNGVKGVNRVVYDISNKPPATIEWE